jgi:hypothetical protein
MAAPGILRPKVVAVSVHWSFHHLCHRRTLVLMNSSYVFVYPRRSWVLDAGVSLASSAYRVDGCALGIGSRGRHSMNLGGGVYDGFSNRFFGRYTMVVQLCFFQIWDLELDCQN